MRSRMPLDNGRGANRGRALHFVVSIGIVSLFADFTYEGGRSIMGPYLAALGGTPVLVGLVAGLGEFLGYAIRLVAGWYVDRRHGHWKIMGVGYALNVLAVPALALTPALGPASVMIALERIGKGVRSPAKNALLSRAGRELGHGYAFGVHEFLDQLGALIGPLVVAAAVLVSGYRLGFAVLLVPALVALFFLWRARGLEPDAAPAKAGMDLHLGRRYYQYLVFMSVVVLGFAHFMLVSYHFAIAQRLAPALIPVLFAVAMVAGGLAAVGAGRLFDRHGFKALYILPFLMLPTAPLLFLSTSVVWIWVGAVFWGAALGVLESIVRAGVAVLTPEALRGTAYGLFDAVFGASWFAGSLILGALYGVNVRWMVIIAIMLQLAAVPLLVALNRRSAAA